MEINIPNLEFHILGLVYWCYYLRSLMNNWQYPFFGGGGNTLILLQFKLMHVIKFYWMDALVTVLLKFGPSNYLSPFTE